MHVPRCLVLDGDAGLVVARTRKLQPHFPCALDEGGGDANGDRPIPVRSPWRAVRLRLPIPGLSWTAGEQEVERHVPGHRPSARNVVQLSRESGFRCDPTTYSVCPFWVVRICSRYRPVLTMSRQSANSQIVARGSMVRLLPCSNRFPVVRSRRIQPLHPTNFSASISQGAVAFPRLVSRPVGEWFQKQRLARWPQREEGWLTPLLPLGVRATGSLRGLPTNSSDRTY